MSTSTLTSLAFLKVNLDEGKDYLDYLRPFILQILVDHQPEQITSTYISGQLRIQFGLEIPKRTIDIVLRRISRKEAIVKENRNYRIVGELPDPLLDTKMSEAKLEIDSVVSGLQQYSQNTVSPISSKEDAVNAICSFLAKFDVTCLRAYVRGTAIPKLNEIQNTDLVLVSEYIQHLQHTSPERFKSFVVLVQGHMLANALLCPDLDNLTQMYKKVTFYLDTPLLVQLLGLEDPNRQSAIQELITLLKNLKGKVSVFSHSRQELEGVIAGAAAYIDSPLGRGVIVQEARARGITKSDLLLIAGSLEEKLGEYGVEIEDSPRYTEALQIDEAAFEQVLDDELSYYNPRAKIYDINSLRSIYAIRGHKAAPTLEKSKAVFVTSNTAFARAAWEYGKEHESSHEVSVVISDFTLTNLAWLKAPVGAPEIPHTQLLAVSYAALSPSKQLLNKYMKEIDRLLDKGRISERDHQLLRSSPHVYPELMHATLGDDSRVTEETVMQTFKRVSMSIVDEESEKLVEEQRAHQETRETLSVLEAMNVETRKMLYWNCVRDSKIMAISISGILFVFLLPGILAGVVEPNLYFPVIVPVYPIVAFIFISLLGLMFGFNILSLYRWVQKQCQKRLFLRRSKAFGIDLSSFESSTQERGLLVPPKDQA